MAQAAGDRDNGDVTARTLNIRLADGQHKISVERNVLFHAPEIVILEHQHGVVVADCRLEQTFGIGGRRGNDDLETRNVHEHWVRAIGMLRRVRLAVPHGGAEGDGHLELAACHVAHAGGLVDDGVGREIDEIGDGEIDDRAQTRHRRADGHASEPAFGNRRAADALCIDVAESAAGGVERDVLADHDGGGITLQLLALGQAERVEIGHPLGVCAAHGLSLTGG